MRIITFACDKYADVAPAYEYLIKKHWPSLPYEIIYVTNSKRLDVDGRVIYIEGQDIMFGWRLRKFLKTYDEGVFLLMMIDYLVKSRVRHNLVLDAVKVCRQDDIGHIRLRPMPHPQLPYPPNDLDFGKIDKRKRYALSLQPGLWKTHVLYKLARDDENPWGTEVRGTGRTKRIPLEFLSTRQTAIVHHNYYKGRKPFGVEWVAENVPEKYWPDALRRKKQ